MQETRSDPSIAAAAIGAAAIVLSFRPIYEPDLWWHLAHGRETAAGRFVRSNLFSYAYGDYRQHYTSWLFDTTAYLSWQAAGPLGIQLIQAVLLALTFALVFLACRIRSAGAGNSAIAAVLLVGFFVLEPRAIPRPHLVSFAGLAACTLLIERARQRGSPSPLWWAVPVVGVWSNGHVECAFGVMLIGVFAVSELIRPSALSRRDAFRALTIATACGLATLANPYGWGLLAYLYENRLVPSLLTIAELLPPPLVPYRAFYAYLALCIAVFAWQWRTVRLSEIVPAVIFAAMGMRFVRLTPLVFLVTAPGVAGRLVPLVRRPRHAQAMMFAGVCAALLVSRVPVRLFVTELTVGMPAVAPDAFFSANAMTFARNAGLEGPLFNSHNLGGYVAWMLYPRAQIFQDSRLQAYPPEHVLSILVASRSQADWNVLVADVDWAVLSLPRPNQLSGVGMFPSPEWATVFRDDAMEIVVRRKGRFGGSLISDLRSSVARPRIED